jgi:hypothetical protein
VIERKDGKGFFEILPAGDVVGSHGKTYLFCGFDEIHGYKTWDIIEALQPDPPARMLSSGSRLMPRSSTVRASPSSI